MKLSPEDKLYKEIQRYIESRGGKVLVIGGIEIQEWPESLPYSFVLGVRVTGFKPNKAGAKK